MASVPALQRLLGSRYPIILAPMFGSSGPDLQAAVADAGGFAFFPGGNLAAPALRAGLQTTRQRLGPAAAPLGVNLWAAERIRDVGSWSRGEQEAAAVAIRRQVALMEELQGAAPALEFQASLGYVEARADCEAVLRGQVEALVEEGVKVVSIHFGWLPEAEVRRLKEARVTLVGNATSVAEALDLERRGADAIIAQGAEAGGHRGTYLDVADYRETAMVGTLQLVCEVTASVSLPVIAAGGIMDGADVRAALAAGAQAVQMGTAFLTAEESLVHPEHRRRLLLGSEGGSSVEGLATVVTQAFTGKPARALANDWSHRMGDVERRLANSFSSLPGGRPLGAAAAKAGRADLMTMWAGEGFPRCRALPAAELFSGSSSLAVAWGAGLAEAPAAGSRL